MLIVGEKSRAILDGRGFSTIGWDSVLQLVYSVLLNIYPELVRTNTKSPKSMVKTTISKHLVQTSLTVLEGLFLAIVVIVMASELVDVQTHIAPHAALPLGRKTGLRIDDGVAALGSLHEFGVLFLEQGEVALSLPVPDAIGREEEIHLFQRALVGLGVQGPNHRDCDGVAGCEDVECLFSQRFEHDRVQETLL